MLKLINDGILFLKMLSLGIKKTIYQNSNLNYFSLSPGG